MVAATQASPAFTFFSRLNAQSNTRESTFCYKEDHTETEDARSLIRDGLACSEGCVVGLWGVAYFASAEPFGSMTMGFLNWLFGKLSKQGSSMAFYKRGIRRAKNHDLDGAQADYTSAIEMRSVSPKIKAMALYNRALVYVARKDEPNAIADLNAVLAMDHTPSNIKTEATRKLMRMEKRSRVQSKQD
jgi:hypothetical protein